MVNPIVLDIIALILIVLAVLEGRRKGLVKMLWKVAAWILTLVLVLVLFKPIYNWALDTEMFQNIMKNVSLSIENNLIIGGVETLSAEKISEATNTPWFFIPTDIIIFEGNTKISAMAETIAETLTRIGMGLILFILIRIVLALLYHILNLATKLPVIHGVNKLLGMAMGLINIMFIIYIVLGIAALSIDAESQWNIVINNTYLVKNFYNNNILLNLINL